MRFRSPSVALGASIALGGSFWLGCLRHDDAFPAAAEVHAPPPEGRGAGTSASVGDASTDPIARDDAQAEAGVPIGDAAAPIYHRVMVGFEDQLVGTTLQNVAAWSAVFATSADSTVTVWFAHDFGTGPYIQTGLTTTAAGFPLFVDFAKPVRGLTFQVLGANALGKSATVQVFQNGAPTGRVDIDGLGNPVVSVGVDLSAFDDITRIEVVDIVDFDSIGFDDFSFLVPD